MDTEQLHNLLRAVPGAKLRLGTINDDMPGILAGDEPVCRTRNTPMGVAYAALLIEAVNALPGMLAALEANSGTDAVEAPALAGDLIHPQRSVVEEKIATVLQMQGFDTAPTKLRSKLIFAAVQPWIVGADAQALSQADLRIADTASAPALKTHGANNQVRLDAVMEFCSFMLAKGSDESMPNEVALESLVTDWDKHHNIKSVEEPGAGA